MSVDRTPVSDADLARMRAEEQLYEQWQRRAARVVASAASNAEDCRLLLSILGLDQEVVAQARAERSAPGRAKARSRASRRTSKDRNHAA